MTDPGPVDELSPDIRVSELVGDRLCARCAFNLSGQTIVREGRYGLLIVRCPECGTAAAIQEYPILGRWANRLAFGVGGLWLLLLTAFLAINVGAMCGLTVGITEHLVGKYANSIARAYATYADANLPPNPATLASVQFSWGGPVQCTPEWWAQQDRSAMLESAGGWWGAIDWRALRQLVYPAMLGLIFGSIWSVALPHGRGWKRLIPEGLAVLIACISIAIHDYDTQTNGWNWAYQGATEAAYGHIGWTVHWIPLTVWIVAITIGLFVGRSIMRWIVQAFLPPRLRAPWSFLWICDGLSLPRPSTAASRV